MSDSEWQKLAEQQEAVLATVTAIKNQLDASEWRRKCVWQLARINRTIEHLQKRFPGGEQTFENILEPLDCYVNLVFKSAQDLRTVSGCCGLIAEILEETEKSEAQSLTDLWKQTYPLIEDLETLDSGDPPSLSVAQTVIRHVLPELRDAERTKVRERFDQRSRDSIDKMFARREAKAKEYY